MADLSRIENLLENIYSVLDDSRSTGGRRTTTSGGRQYSDKRPRFDQFLTGIRDVDNATSSFARSKTNAEMFGKQLRGAGINLQRFSSKLGDGKFGKLLNSAGGNLNSFGKNVSKSSQLIAAFTTAINGVVTLIEGLTEVQNLKGKADAAGVKWGIKENQLQFQRDSKLTELSAEKTVAGINKEADLALKTLELEGNVMLQRLKILSDNQIKAVEIAIGSVTNGINETAYSAAEYELNRRKDLKLLDIQKAKSQKELSQYSYLREQQYQMQTDLLDSQENLAKESYKSESMINERDKVIGLRDMETEVKDKILNTSTKTGTQLGAGLGGALGSAFGGRSGGAAGSAFGSVVGKAIGMPIGIVSGLNDQTMNNAYGVSGQTQRGMTNVFKSQGNFDKSAYDFRNNGYMLSSNEKWFNKYLNWNPESGEMIWSAGIDQLSNELKMVAEGNNTLVSTSNKIREAKIEKQTDILNKILDINTQASETLAEMEIGQQTNWLKLAETIEKELDVFDKLSNDLGISYGYTNRAQLDAFQKEEIRTAAMDAAIFGKDYEDIAKIKTNYIETTGRNNQFTQTDNRSMMALGKYLGDDGLAANYASEMEIFNVGVADSVDMLDNVLQDVNRIGLNGRKYTKTLVDSLKLAQKYNFKGGTENLMKMAKWAENTRFNMNSLGGMLDKISEGGLEGVITQGAQLQVLGGHAAMNADPIAMWWERYNDPDAFAKRMQDMTKGYGSLNRTTGETTFNMNEQMLMENIAKAQGRPVEDVMNEVRARNKKEVVSKQLNSNFDEDEQSFISNLATYNKKTGQFEVKVKGENGQYETKEVNQLTKGDIQNLMPEKHEERMEDYMVTVIDYLAKMTGETKSEQTTLMGDNWETRQENYKERLLTAQNNFAENHEKFNAKIEEFSGFITKSYQGYIDMFAKGNDEANSAIAEIKDKANKIGSALLDTSEIINEANKKIEKLLGLYTTPKNDNETQKLSNMTFGHDRYGKMYVKKYENGQLVPDEEATREFQSWQVRKKNMKKTSDGILSSNNTPIISNASNVTPIHDGIVTNNNKPIVSQVTNVTKINDGLVQSDPKDVAIFAKEGGVIGNFLDKLYNDVHSSMGGGIQSNTINVQISGSLDLSSGGQSVNIINELQNNPILLRALSRMLSEQLSNALNGGRGSLPISIGNV